MPSWTIPSVFWLMYHKYLGFRAKYGEWGKFAASVGHPKAKRFSASGGLWPLTLWPWALPLDLADGGGGFDPRPPLALAMCVHPTFLDLATPLNAMRMQILCKLLHGPWAACVSFASSHINNPRCFVLGWCVIRRTVLHNSTVSSYS